MQINLYHPSLICGSSTFYDAEAQRQMSASGRSITRPAATEATTITVPLTELELEHFCETFGHTASQWVDGVMDAVRQQLDPFIIWLDKDHINKEATMKRIQESNWGSEIKKQVAMRQKYIERATNALRKEHGEQIATLQSMVADLLEENARQKKEYESRTASLEKTVSDLTKRLFPLEVSTPPPPPTHPVVLSPLSPTPLTCSSLPPSPPASETSVKRVSWAAPVNRNDTYARQAQELREARMIREGRMDRELTAMEQRSFYN
jgi:hypothetical protein